MAPAAAWRQDSSDASMPIASYMRDARRTTSAASSTVAGRTAGSAGSMANQFTSLGDGPQVVIGGRRQRRRLQSRAGVPLSSSHHVVPQISDDQPSRLGQ